VQDLTDTLRSRYQISASKGAVITQIDPDSGLAGIGASTGDVIGQVDDVPIENAADFRSAAVKFRLKPSVVILLQRGVSAYYITVRM
jgi:S1-C subfamily serine protease